MSEESDIVKELEQEWTPEHGNAGTFKAPEGNCVLRCTNAFLNRSQKGRRQLQMACEVVSHETDPSAKGSKVPVRYGLEKVPDDYKRLNTVLVNLQLEVIKGPQDLMRACKELSGVCFAAKLVANDDPQFPPNVYINAGARRKDLETVSGSGSSSGSTARFA